MIKSLADIIKRKVLINSSKENKIKKIFKTFKLKIDTMRYLRKHRLITSENVYALMNMMLSECTNVISDNICISKIGSNVRIDNYDTGDYTVFKLIKGYEGVDIEIFNKDNNSRYLSCLTDLDSINKNEYMLLANSDLQYICNHILDEYIFL